VNRRLAEIHQRYGSEHLVSRSIRNATPLILQAVGHAQASKTLTPQVPGGHPVGAKSLPGM
jgi:hypothetical protein